MINTLEQHNLMIARERISGLMAELNELRVDADLIVDYIQSVRESLTELETLAGEIEAQLQGIVPKDTYEAVLDYGGDFETVDEPLVYDEGDD